MADKKKAKSFQPFWGNQGEKTETCEHRFGTAEECEKYAHKRMTDAGMSLCGSVESDADPNITLEAALAALDDGAAEKGGGAQAN